LLLVNLLGRPLEVMRKDGTAIVFQPYEKKPVKEAEIDLVRLERMAGYIRVVAKEVKGKLPKDVPEKTSIEDGAENISKGDK